MHANLENSALAMGLDKIRFHSNSKEKQCQRMFKLLQSLSATIQTISLISHASKVMLKILQGTLQQYVNWGLPEVQAGFRKGTSTTYQIANISYIRKKQDNFREKKIYFCRIDYARAFSFVNHNKLWKVLQVMGIPHHLTRLLRNPYAGQEATVST